MVNGGKLIPYMDPPGNWTILHVSSISLLSIRVFSVGCFFADGRIVTFLHGNGAATAFTPAKLLISCTATFGDFVDLARRHGALVSVDYSREHESNQNDPFRDLCCEWINSACCTHISKKPFDRFASEGTRFVDLFSIEQVLDVHLIWIPLIFFLTLGPGISHKKSASQNA